VVQRRSGRGVARAARHSARELASKRARGPSAQPPADRALDAILTQQHGVRGATQDTVNRNKMIKRQMYGRAKFDLLRKRILVAA
jgi:transposase